MVEQAAAGAGLPLDRLYFNVGRVGNVSAASIPLAIRDAVADGVISAPVRVFTPAFGAGATAGYAVMRVDPAVVSLAQPGLPPARLGQARRHTPEGRQKTSASDLVSKGTGQSCCGTRRQRGLRATRARRCPGPARAAGTCGCRARWAAPFPARSAR